MSIPRKPTEVEKLNFQTLLSAAENGDLALMTLRRKADGTVCAALCAMQTNDDATITPVPLAVLVNGNPFEMFEDPTAGEET